MRNAKLTETYSCDVQGCEAEHHGYFPNEWTLFEIKGVVRHLCPAHAAQLRALLAGDFPRCAIREKVAPGFKCEGCIFEEWTKSPSAAACRLVKDGLS